MVSALAVGVVGADEERATSLLRSGCSLDQLCSQRLLRRFCSLCETPRSQIEPGCCLSASLVAGEDMVVREAPCWQAVMPRRILAGRAGVRAVGPRYH